MAVDQIGKIREALAHPHYVEPLPTNDVVELRMPLRVYEEAIAALKQLETDLEIDSAE